MQNETTTPPVSVPPKKPGQPAFHITRLEIDSFKRITATAISPATGKPVLLTGDNGQGKSSVLDSILWAFENSGVGKPIMEGQPSARVGVEISDGTDRFIIMRRAKGPNRYLEVTTGDGEEVKKPQAFLDGLVGNLAFDPEAFARLKDKEQANQLRAATGLDTEEIDDKIKTTFTLRAAANKEETAAEAAYRAAPAVAGTERTILSAGSLATERDILRDALHSAKAAREAVVEIDGEIEGFNRVIADLQARLEAATKQRQQSQEEREKFESFAVAKEAETTDHKARIEAITEQLGKIDQDNAEIQRHNDALALRTRRHEAWKAANKKAADLDKELESLRATRAKTIVEAKMPVEGLAIEDDVVTLDGIPLSDLNTAKRIEVATRIAIAQNPRLGVIFVREGALINETNLAVIADIAESAGMQLWIEKFQPQAGPSGLHIIDGMIAIEDGKPAGPVQQDLL